MEWRNLHQVVIVMLLVIHAWVLLEVNACGVMVVQVVYCCLLHQECEILYYTYYIGMVKTIPHTCTYVHIRMHPLMYITCDWICEKGSIHAFNVST